jgi:hypothetical protein
MTRRSAEKLCSGVFDAAAMEVGDHLMETGQAPGHVAQQVVLVAVVQSDVWIGVPYQNAIYAPVALIEIVKVAVRRVFASYGIVEITVLHHHLRLDETALSPLEFRAGVLGTVVADAYAALRAPVLNVGKPRCERCRVGRTRDFLILG